MVESAFPALPGGLPPGRLVVPEEGPEGVMALWVSDEPQAELGELWCRLYDERARTGLYPLLLDTLGGEPARPWHDGELFVDGTVADIDALDVEAVLRGGGSGGEDAAVPWPGLAPPGDGVEDADEFARVSAESGAEDAEFLLGLVPAARGADTLTVMGWSGPVNHSRTAEISAVVRSWEERFGARVVMVGFDVLGLSVAAPPRTIEHARAVAAEHEAFCPDNIWQGVGDREEYAAGLVGRPSWSFWWD
ncbi:DUF4253 domain-containing protein [Actinomadura violacea]|uniref:DUF4253 domain-containing protein n=1 Tax=Actinomadura violacea TaxID=2819934 RepID=A0ABS3S2A2_9ACTN|nr:DUF4253 domain-containing protein [Actinomadura violacea]MBO2463129.1 DUF4253 domain-containing protein [Actinomadura violacea]